MRAMNLYSRFFAASALLATALAPSIASADTSFGGEGQFILSADRLFGFTVASIKRSPEDGDNYQKQSVSNLSLLGISSVATTPLNPYLSPNFGIHYTVIPALTIGGNLGYARASGSSETKEGNTTTKTDGEPTNVLLISPKVGYIINLAPNFSLWLRGGITYYRGWSSDEEDDNNKVSTTWSGFGLNIDPQLVFSPAEHVGITLGPVLDIPLTGSLETEVKQGNTTVTTKYDLKASNYGATIGLLAHF